MAKTKDNLFDLTNVSDLPQVIRMRLPKEYMADIDKVRALFELAGSARDLTMVEVLVGFYRKYKTIKTISAIGTWVRKLHHEDFLEKGETHGTYRLRRVSTTKRAA